MIRLIKLGNLIYENIEAKTIDPKTNQEIWNVPNTVSQLEKAFADTLLWLEKQRINQICDQYGYNGLADVQFYASQNDEEAKAILDWYQAYDDGIWTYIDNTLPTIATLKELLVLDMKAIEKQIFDQAVATAPLPPNEG